MSFTLCLNTSTIKPQPILEKIRLAAEAGFAGIELWINDVYEYVGQGGEVRDIEKALSDHGLIVPCTIAVRGWGEAVGPEYPIMLDEVKRRMEMAARLGAPYLVATPPRDECPDCQLVERYRDLLAIGRKIGIKPTFEYISFFGSVNNLAQVWQIIQEVDDPDATLILDAFHTYNGGGTLEDLRPNTRREDQPLSHRRRRARQTAGPANGSRSGNARRRTLGPPRPKSTSCAARATKAPSAWSSLTRTSGQRTPPKSSKRASSGCESWLGSLEQRAVSDEQWALSFELRIARVGEAFLVNSLPRTNRGPLLKAHSYLSVTPQPFSAG